MKQSFLVMWPAKRWIRDETLYLKKAKDMVMCCLVRATAIGATHGGGGGFRAAAPSKAKFKKKEIL
jgi:hypothetical protein